MSEVPMPDVYQHLAELGYSDELVATDGKLVNPASGATIDPGQVRAAETSRFEGPTDPDDAAIVVAVASLDGEPLGVFTAPYGPNASADEAAVLTAMKPASINQPPTDAPGTDNYSAAVFPDTSTAEVAIDELRQMGVDAAHIGVAVATDEALAVDTDDEADVYRDLRWGSGLDDVEDHQRTPALVLEHGEVLVMAPRYDHPSAVEAALQRHGGRLVDMPDDLNLDPQDAHPTNDGQRPD